MLRKYGGIVRITRSDDGLIGVDVLDTDQDGASGPLA